MNKQVVCFIALCFSLSAGLNDAVAQNNEGWDMQVQAHAIINSYDNNTERKDSLGSGLFLNGEYQQTLGFNTAFKAIQMSVRGAADIRETSVLLGGYINLLAHKSMARLTLGMDGYSIVDRGAVQSVLVSRGRGMGGMSISSQTQDEAAVIQPQLAYLSADKSFYAAVEYALSEYDSNDPTVQNLKISQWSPALGFGFNKNYDWLQFRGYLIDVTEGLDLGVQNSTSAVEAKWLHWFKDNSWKLNNIYAMAVFGDRINAVDPDAKVVYTLSEIQTGQLEVGAKWRLANQFYLFAIYGREDNEALSDAQSFSNSYVFVSLTKEW